MLSLRKSFSLLCMSLLLTSGLQAQKWAQGALFPEPSEEVYGIASSGKMYVFGGLGPEWTAKSMVYAYDPTTNIWTKKKNMPQPSHHVALTELNGKIYLLGGFVKPETGPNGWLPIDNCWEYDTANDSWKALSPLPTKRGSASAVVSQGKIYVIGGAALHPGSKETAVRPLRPHRAVGTNEMYDPSTNRWESKSSMPTPRNHAAIGSVNNKIYVIGGRIGAAFISKASNTDLVEEYDPLTDQWGIIKARMPTARSAAAWGLYKDKIYVVGGEFQSYALNGTYKAAEAYDPTTDSWSILPSMPTPRHGLAGGMIGNHFHLVSGDIQSGGAPNTVIETSKHDILELP